jgi:transketolase
MSNAPVKVDQDIRDAFFDALYDIAREDRQVIFLTADMGARSLERFRKDLPKQYMNVGVAEQNMVSVAAGLALAGKRVFIYAIAPFATQRCYEQIKVDLSGMGLPVTIIGAGPGIAYHSDGPTHHAVLDIAIMRALPGMVILNPSDAFMASRTASLCCQSGNPVYVRLDKGKLPPLYSPGDLFSEGLSLIQEGGDLLIVSTGAMVHKALRVAEKLKSGGIEAAVMDVYRLKPIDEPLFLHYADRWGKMVTLEEHSLMGGLGSIVSEILADHGERVAVKRFGIRDMPCEGYGDREWMHTRYGLDDRTLIESISAWQ